MQRMRFFIGMRQLAPLVEDVMAQRPARLRRLGYPLLERRVFMVSFTILSLKKRCSEGSIAVQFAGSDSR
jgi:hypothetical protein